jgi:hypothetical protein
VGIVSDDLHKGFPLPRKKHRRLVADSFGFVAIRHDSAQNEQRPTGGELLPLRAKGSTTRIAFAARE